MKRLQSASFERLISVSRGRENFARILTLLFALQVLWSFPIPSLAQTKPIPISSSQQPGTSASTEAPNPQDTVPLTQIVAQTEALTRLLRDIEQRLDPGATLADIDRTLGQLEQELRERKGEVDETIAQDPSLTELSALERDWSARSAPYAKWQKQLSERIKMLESDLRLLDTHQAQWQATINQIEGDSALKEIIDRVRNKLADIQRIRSRIAEETNEIVVLQNKVSLQDQMVSETVGTITETKGRLQRSLLVRDGPPLWKANFGGPRIFKASYRRELTRFTRFIKAKPSVIYGAMIIFVIALFFAIEFKRRLPRLAKTDLIPEEGAHLFSRAFSLAMLAALMWGVTAGPSVPVMMRNLIALLSLVPIVRLFLPLIRPAWRALVYILVVFALASPAVETFGASDSARRVGAAVLDAAFVVMSVWLVRRSGEARKGFRKRAVLAFAAMRIGLLILLASLVGNVFGYAALSHVLRAGVILASFLALILYTLYRVTIAIISTLLRSHLAAKIKSVGLHSNTVLRWVSGAIEMAALLIWLYLALGFFTILSEVVDWVAGTLSASILPGTISLSLGDVLAFVLTLFLGVIAAKAIRALLQEDVIPQLSPKRGLPNALSTLIYYALVTVVFFLALAAAGTDFSRFTIMTGAFGLGVGFGLQTVINNLASGVLLLVERPINVGDVLEVEGMTGVVKRIGLRSSTVRTSQGAEVIVPNTNLITNRVINWTLSERNRRVDLPVGIAYGTDPQRVINLLVEVASSHPDVVREPAPVALFIAFGDSALNFELRFWSPFASTYQQLRSDVAVRIVAALREAGIAIPFPQRDIHLKSVESSITKPVAAEPQGPDVAPQG